jgi:hypothetical protein
MSHENICQIYLVLNYNDPDIMHTKIDDTNNYSHDVWGILFVSQIPNQSEVNKKIKSWEMTLFDGVE